MKKVRPRVTRAISLRQPFVELILRGKKKIEYRSVPTHIRERIYLYASKKPVDWPEAWADADAEPGELPTGVIVGTVEIADCRYDGRNDEFHYILKSPKRFSRPLRFKNQPQPIFWRPILIRR